MLTGVATVDQAVALFTWLVEKEHVAEAPPVRKRRVLRSLAADRHTGVAGGDQGGALGGTADRAPDRANRRSCRR